MRKQLKRILLNLHHHLPPNLQGHMRAAFYNTRALFHKDSERKFFQIKKSDKSVWHVKRGEEEIFLAVPDRLGFYRDGIEARLSALQNAFVLPEMDIKKHDIVVDVGANIGEFSLPLLKRGVQSFLFEMDPNVLGALRSNLKKYGHAKIFNIGLWYENKVIPMFIETATADTSLIPNGSTRKIEIECRRLDDIEDLKQVSTIKLFKCDAEGAEPEVLNGARDTLKRTEYVAIDCGPERGLSKERTRHAVEEFLKGCDFQILPRKGSAREVVFARNTALSPS